MHNKIIAFDLDDVLCYRTSEKGKIEKYYTSKPNKQMIEVVNSCYDLGAKIIIYTARGMNSYKKNVDEVHENLYELTKQQLGNWGIKHHELIMGKIHYDLLIDDKAVNSAMIKNINDVKDMLK